MQVSMCEGVHEGEGGDRIECVCVMGRGRIVTCC